LIKVFAALVLVVVVVLGSYVSYSGRTVTVQSGYRGTGSVQLFSPATLATSVETNAIPEADPIDEPDPTLPPVRKQFKNVQVLDDLSVLEFSRLMGAFATWIAPQEGCSYCHNPDNLASDEKYTKRVARRMIQMVRHINNDWKAHVAETGVTCWTCHRGRAVPTGDWYSRTDDTEEARILGNTHHADRAGMTTNGNSALPYDPLSAYLVSDADVRVQATQALPGSLAQPNSNFKARTTYALMIYMSKSLGVNCNYCHSTRAFANWAQSTPQRVTAWQGIRMVRQLNSDVLIPISEQLPAYRLGQLGDGPKLACATCHKGTFKPLGGVSMKKDFAELWRVGGPQRDTGYVSPPNVEVRNPVVPPETLMQQAF
jgi:photosynthetic reaction center cytochrome c subunit